MKDDENCKRLVQVQWASYVGESFKATFEVIAEDHGTLLADVSVQLANMRVPIHELNARKLKDGNVQKMCIRDRLYALCKSYGLHLIIDAAQTAGVLPIDLKKMPDACLCTAGHKSLYGPTGTGLLVVSPGRCV